VGALGAARAGVVTLQPDPDGHVRRLPLFHEADGAVLPALALAGLALADGAGAPPREGGAAPPRVVREAGRFSDRIRVGERAWPVNAAGEVVLRFPSRLEALEVIPFHQVVLAALDRPGAAGVAAKLAGRTVVLGSSAARLGDYVQTPLGRQQGVVVTAMALELLARGEVLAPPAPGANALLLAIALIVPALSFHRRLGNAAAFPWVASPVAVALVLATATLLFLQGRQATMLYPVLVSLAALFADLVGRLVALQRIRQRLAAEKLAAERASELKSQFMSHMTHELRTPMTAILGFNRRMAAPGVDAATRAHYIEVVEKNSRHLLTLINNLLDGAKLEAGQMRLATAPVAVRELMDDVVQTLTPLAEAKGLALAVRQAEGVPAGLELDPLRLKQVLLNLGGNAVKFTERGGVTLALAWRDGRLTVAVEDTGPGMDAAQLERVFVPFQQAHERVAQKHGGTGLGLAISRNLCELMGGSLTARSEPGRGSSFVAEIRAPIAELPAPAPAPAEAPAAPARVPPRPARVLLVDDSEDLRDLVGLYLADAGLQVSMAGDGAEALEAARRDPPDAVLTDMEMPRMNGADLARALRAAGYARPIVLLTAHPEGPDTQLALQAGCDAYVAKPVDAALLHSTIHTLMEASR
jgi:signal transduction histidine kinase